MIIVARNETNTLEMRCEMSQYIQPDSNLHWFKDGLEIVSDGEKYEVIFKSGGDDLAMVNGRKVPSRVSVLVVSNFQQDNDTGCYYCMTVDGSYRSNSVAVTTGAPGLILQIYLSFLI